MRHDLSPFPSFMMASERHRVLAALAVFCALLLLVVLAFRAATEPGGTNSFALVADSLLHLRPWVTGCFDSDCAVIDGRSYVVFPPLPGVVAIPLVAAFGTGTAGFMAIGLAAMLVSILLWQRILSQLDVEGEALPWLLLAITFASPLFYVTLRTEKVWFFAQALAFLFVTLSVHEALAKRLFTAGIAIGLAFLCRQLSIFYAPLLVLLVFNPSEPLLRLNAERFRQAFALMLPVICATGAYFAYNYWRFGDPFDTGYAGITFSEGVLKRRTDELGLWDSSYVVYNAFYLLLQGFHANFDEARKLSVTGMDSGGTGILAASPWLLLMFLAPLRRLTLFIWVVIAGFATVLLFYHSNGFSQFNTQRYVLDWLPAALLVLAMVFQRGTAKGGWVDVLKLLVLWGMFLNVATVAVLALTRTSA
jgi:hypothetical protein